MGFLEAVKNKIELVTGQVPITGFFMDLLNCFVVLLRVVRAVFFTFPTFFRFLSLFCATFDSKNRIGIWRRCVYR